MIHPNTTYANDYFKNQLLTYNDQNPMPMVFL